MARALRVLTLALKREFFDAIKAGTKLEEYRLRNDYWMQRLENRTYDAIELTLGYPAADNTERRLRRPWRGFTVKTITHSFFGSQPVQVYAINVAPTAARR
jgi:hypothetical protein